MFGEHRPLRTTRALRHTFVPLLALVLGLVVSTAVAQPLNPGPLNQARNPGALDPDAAPGMAQAFLPPPRELRLELNRAATDIEGERYVDAIRRLDVILRRDATTRDDNVTASEWGEDFFILDARQLPETSLKIAALRLLAELPTAGREAYELQFGNEAAQLLQQAVTARDPELLERVARQFTYTEAGQTATLLAARANLERNQPRGAILHLNRLQAMERARARFGVELPVLLATAHAMTGDDGAASEILRKYGEAHPDSKLVQRGTAKGWFQAGEEPLEWLREITGPLDLPSRTLVKDWRMFGGDQQRLAVADVDLPLKAMRWELPFSIDPKQLESLQDQSKFQYSQHAATPTLHPLVVDGWMIMQTVDQLVGVRVDSGRREWKFPWATDPSIAYANGRVAGRGGQGGGDHQLLLQRVWDDSLHNLLSSDGKSVFFVQSPTNPDDGMGLGIESNELVALDLGRQGYLQWVVGGVDGGDDPKLANTFFLGPPLPIGDQLFVMTEVNSELRLVVLGSSDGKLVWSQQLGHVDSGYLRNRTPSVARRMAGSNPAYAEGIVVCPTSASSVVAIDVAQRALLWGFQYDGGKTRQPRQRQTRGGQDRWRDNAVTIAEGKVLITPPDANEIFCLDLLTGNAVWEQPQARGTNLFVGGVHNNHAVLVGKEGLTSIDLATGKHAWTLTWEPSVRPSGRGLQSDHHYLLATTTPEIIKVDMRDGKIVDRVRSTEPLGNLAAYQDQIISQNHRVVRAYYQRDKLAKRVDERLATNPLDPWAREQQAILLLDAGRWEEGIDALRQTMALLPPDSEDALAIKTQLVSTMLERLRSGAPGLAKLASELDALLDPAASAQRSEFLRLMAVHLQRDGSYADAFRKHLDLFHSEGDGGQRRGDWNAEMVDVSPHRKVSSMRWYRSTFTELWQAADPQDREELSRLVSSQLQEAKDPLLRSRLVEVFWDLPPAAPYLLESLQQQVKTGRALAVTEGQLRRLSHAENRPVAAAAIAELAEMYVRAGRTVSAGAMYHRLLTQFGDEPLAGDRGTGESIVRAAMIERPQLESYLRSEDAPNPQVWPHGTIEHSIAESPEPQAPALRLRQQQTPRGPLSSLPEQLMLNESPSDFDVVYDRQNLMQTRDANGVTGHLVSLNNIMPSAARHDFLVKLHQHLIVVSRAEAIVVIDGLANSIALEDKVLWQSQDNAAWGVATSVGGAATIPLNFPLGLSRRVERNSGDGANPVAMGPVSDRGIILRRWGDLVALDPATGDTIWICDDVDVKAEVWGDDEHVFVHAADDRLARIFRVIDGKELESQPVPDLRRRIRAFDHYLFTQRDDVDGVRLQVNDIFGSWTWNRTFDADSKATFVDEQLLAIYSGATRKLQIFSIRDGKPIVDTPLETELSQVDRLQVEVRAGMFIVTLGKEVTDQSKFRSTISTRKLQQMEVYAFDAESGERRWDVPAKINESYLPIELHAPGLPILVYARREEATPRQHRVLILDARDGRKIMESSSDLLGGIMEYQVQGDPETKTIQLKVPAAQGDITLTFTDKPRAPAPPFGYETKVARTRDKPFAIFGTLFKAVGKGVQVQVDPTQNIDDLFGDEDLLEDEEELDPFEEIEDLDE